MFYEKEGFGSSFYLKLTENRSELRREIYMFLYE